MENTMFFQLAGVSIQVDSDYPITIDSFAPKFKQFQIADPGDDLVKIVHHIDPGALEKMYDQPVYKQMPYAVFHQDKKWIYDVLGSMEDRKPFKRFVCSEDYTELHTYHANDSAFQHKLASLSGASTDQLFFVHLLADRKSTFLHSSGIKFKNKGFLFVGQSEAGKSTMIKLTRHVATPLCDERIILRKWPDGFRIHGNWSHGELPEVTAEEAPLAGIFFLEKASHNKLLPIQANEALPEFIIRVVRGIPNALWWEKQLSLIEKALQVTPLYRLQFDKSGKVVELLESLL